MQKSIIENLTYREELEMAARTKCRCLSLPKYQSPRLFEYDNWN